MTEHPDVETFERFAIGALDRDESFVAHVASCDACSEKLAREARLELALREVQALRRATTRSARLPAGLLRLGPPLVLAAAAALLVLVRSAPRAPGEARPDPSAASTTSAESAAPAGAEEPKIPDADEVIAGLRPAFRRCFQDALASHPNASGRAVIEAHVAPDGAVTHAAVGSNDGLPLDVTACLTRVVAGARFTGAGRPTTLRIPVSFVQKK